MKMAIKSNLSKNDENKSYSSFFKLFKKNCERTMKMAIKYFWLLGCFRIEGLKLGASTLKIKVIKI